MKTLYHTVSVPLNAIVRMCCNSRKWVPPFLCICLLVLSGGVQAGQTRGELLSALEAEGFENLVVEDEADGSVRIQFEDRRYRWEVTGLGVALAIASSHCDGRLVLVSLHTGVPVLRLELFAEDYRAFVRGELNADEFFSRVVITNSTGARAIIGRNRSFGKVDLTFAPGVRINLVTPPMPGDFNGGELRLNPGVYANLAPGLTFDGTYTYPLSRTKPLISRAAASYNARLGEQGFLQVQGGRLSAGLNGFAAQVSYLSRDGDHLFGVNAANAGFEGWKREFSYEAFYSVRAWDVVTAQWNRVVGPESRYRYEGEPLDVMLTLSGGRYLKGDNGVGLKLTSGFGESRLEFQVTKTNLNRVAGVGFAVPLGWPLYGTRQPYPTPVRLRFNNQFAFLYTDLDSGAYKRSGAGLSVPFSDRYQFQIRRLNRAYLRGYADAMREAGARWLSEDVTQSGE